MSSSSSPSSSSPWVVVQIRNIAHHCHLHCTRTTDKNILSGIVNICMILVVVVAMIHPHWFYLSGGGCNTQTLGLYIFFHTGYFSTQDASDPHASLNYFTNGYKLTDCVTQDIVVLMQVVIGLVFLMISAATIQTLLDFTAPHDKCLSFVRRNAVGSIVAVWVCVFGMGITCHVGMLIEAQQVATKTHITSTTISPDQQPTHVVVAFHTGFYLLVTAGWIGVLGVSCSWLRPAYIFQEMESQPLTQHCHDVDDNILPISPLPPAIITDTPPPPPLEGHPPPPYTP